MISKIKAFWLTIIIFSSFIVIIIEIAPIVEAPNIIYVDDDYTSEDATHKKTIQAAVNVANLGDTVFIFNGTYKEHVIVNKCINLTGINKDNTTVDGSGSGVIVRVTASWTNISGLTVTGSGLNLDNAGIELENVHNCSVYDTISLSNHYGILLDNSWENNIINNIIPSNDNYYGIHLRNSVKNNITSNSINTVKYYAIILSSSTNNNISSNILTSNYEDAIYLTNSNKNFLYNNDVLNNRDGINLGDSYRNEIWSNTVSSSEYDGIYLYYSDKNILYDNTISNNGRGIVIRDSNENNITDNTISGNDNGIWIRESSEKNIVKSNSITSSFWEGVKISESTNNEIVDNTFSDNMWAVYFQAAANGNIIKENVMSLNDRGMRIWNSNNNHIICNEISNNLEYGIHVVTSQNNKIYHNYINNNPEQASDDSLANFWNDVYPSGGNYWSDYSGNDNLKGPNQNIPGQDHIGDTPYTNIQGGVGASDNYPLMESPPRLLENFIILKQGWNQISIPLIQKEQNLTRVLGAIDSWYDAVRVYSSSDISDPWKKTKIGKPFGNDLSELNETMAFWIHITRAGDTIFLYNGTTPSTSQKIQLYKGWNLVGYPSLTSYNRTDGLNNTKFGSQIIKIMWYNASSQTWFTLDENDYFMREQGYWIYAKVKVTWNVPL